MVKQGTKTFTCMILGVFLVMGNAMADTKEAEFWTWFEANEQLLYEFEADQERIFDRLGSELAKVDPNLTFEFGPKQDDGWREFVISAGGIRDSFPAVESLFSAAPKLDRWKFVKFRPRREAMTVCLGDRCIAPEDVHFQMFEDGDKIGIMLFFDGFRQSDRDFFAHAGYLMLDQALGEFTVETEVGFIEFAGRDSKYFDSKLVLPTLARTFDDILTRKQ